MKKFVKNESGFAIVEAAIIFPIILLTTILLFLLTMYLYERITLQYSLDWYVGKLSQSLGFSFADATVNDEGSIRAKIINSPKNPYRYFNSSTTNVEIYENNVMKFADSYSAIGTQSIDVNIKITNYVIYQEVSASAVKEFKLPINFSFIGITENPKLFAVSKRMTHDPDEFMRNVDLIFDVSSYVNEKYQITDRLSKAFENIKNFKK